MYVGLNGALQLIVRDVTVLYTDETKTDRNKSLKVSYM